MFARWITFSTMMWLDAAKTNQSATAKFSVKLPDFAQNNRNPHCVLCTYIYILSATCNIYIYVHSTRNESLSERQYIYLINSKSQLQGDSAGLLLMMMVMVVCLRQHFGSRTHTNTHTQYTEWSWSLVVYIYIYKCCLFSQRSLVAFSTVRFTLLSVPRERLFARRDFPPYIRWSPRKLTH